MATRTQSSRSSSLSAPLSSSLPSSEHTTDNKDHKQVDKQVDKQIDTKQVDTKKLLFDAAVALLEEVGPTQLSLREVARRASVSHQAPYHYFSTKQVLLTEIVIQGFAELDDSMREMQTVSNSDVFEQLIACGMGYILFARRHPAKYRLMMNRECESALLDPAIMHVAGSSYRRLLQTVTSIREFMNMPVDAASIHRDAHVCWTMVHGVAWFSIDGVWDSMSPNQDGLAHARDVLKRMSDMFRIMHTANHEEA